MSGYSMQERKIGKSQRRRVEQVCGGCGGTVERGKLICEECVETFTEESTELGHLRQLRNALIEPK
jgi:predicted amidophosphoribosyltransferase